MSSISQQTVMEIETDIIREELLGNFEKNAVFEVYRAAILSKIERVLRKEATGSAEEVEGTDILLTLEEQAISEHIDHAYREDMYGISVPITLRKRAFWNHLVAILFMRQLKKAYPSIQSDHLDLLDEEESYFTEKEFEDYLEVESQLITREDIFKSIEDLKLPAPVRLHIVVNAAHHSLDDEISYYLQDSYPFTTMVYVERGNIGYITTWDENRQPVCETRKFKYFKRGEFIEDTYPRTSKRKTGLGNKNKNT